MKSASPFLFLLAFASSVQASPAGDLPRKAMDLRDLSTPETPTAASSGIFAEFAAASLVSESVMPVMFPTGKSGAPGFPCPLMICKDYMNKCGKKYGGCYDMCLGEVKYTDPGCPPKKPTPTSSRAP